MITLIAVSDAIHYPVIANNMADGAPNATAMALFTIAPHVLEGAELTESTEETDQGRLLAYEVRMNLYRESNVAWIFRKKNVVLYIETLGGEKHLLGTLDNPMRISYTRSTGMAVTDNNETAVRFVGRYPI